MGSCVFAWIVLFQIGCVLLVFFFPFLLLLWTMDHLPQLVMEQDDVEVNFLIVKGDVLIEKILVILV